MLKQCAISKHVKFDANANGSQSERVARYADAWHGSGLCDHGLLLALSHGLLPLFHKAVSTQTGTGLNSVSGFPMLCIAIDA